MPYNQDKPAKRDAMRLCYVCRMPISVLATKCRYCGADVGRPRKEQETFTVEDLGGEKIGTYTISGNVTEALESFMQEEQAQLKEEERERSEVSRRLKGRLPVGGGPDSKSGDLPTEYVKRSGEDNEAVESPPGLQEARKQPTSGETRKRVITIVWILTGLFVLYLGLAFGGTCLGNEAQEDISGDAMGMPNKALQMLASGASLDAAHQEALRALKVNNSEENSKIMQTIRAKAIEHIKSLAYASPFDREKLTKAVRDVTRMAERDTDINVIRLMEEINREIGYFAFILTEFDPEKETATFRLNNPALKENVQQVKVGGLLQERFEVLAVNKSNVILEDTHPEGQGRRLIARKMMEVEAY